MKKKVEQDARYVASLDADETRERLAEIYAKALIGAAKEMGASYKELWEEYDSFIDVCNAFPALEKILASAITPAEEKKRILDEVCVSASPVFSNFLKVLARRERFYMLRYIRKSCRELDKIRRGSVPIQITTATSLSEETKNSLTANLKKLVGGEPEFSVKVDPETIGGIIVRVGDVVYDASIATQLNKVRQDIIDRSAHEIQNRRDCFRNPEGN